MAPQTRQPTNSLDHNPHVNSTHLAFPYRRLAWFGVLVASFIVYGSLIPFVYRPVPLDQAISQFAHIKWFDIKAGGRADWVANLVLYFPFGFLVSGALSKTSLLRAALTTCLLGCALAIGVEFLQISGRT